jgi:hypothetical protein
MNFTDSSGLFLNCWEGGGCGGGSGPNLFFFDFSRCGGMALARGDCDPVLQANASEIHGAIGSAATVLGEEEDRHNTMVDASFEAANQRTALQQIGAALVAFSQAPSQTTANTVDAAVSQAERHLRGSGLWTILQPMLEIYDSMFVNASFGNAGTTPAGSAAAGRVTAGVINYQRLLATVNVVIAGNQRPDDLIATLVHEGEHAINYLNWAYELIANTSGHTGASPRSLAILDMTTYELETSAYIASAHAYIALGIQSKALNSFPIVTNGKVDHAGIEALIAHEYNVTPSNQGGRLSNAPWTHQHP